MSVKCYCLFEILNSPITHMKTIEPYKHLTIRHHYFWAFPGRQRRKLVCCWDGVRQQIVSFFYIRLPSSNPNWTLSFQKIKFCKYYTYIFLAIWVSDDIISESERSEFFCWLFCYLFMASFMDKFFCYLKTPQDNMISKKGTKSNLLKEK